MTVAWIDTSVGGAHAVEPRVPGGLGELGAQCRGTGFPDRDGIRPQRDGLREHATVTRDVDSPNAASASEHERPPGAVAAHSAAA